MTEPDRTEKPKASIDEVLAEFDRRERTLEDLCLRTKGLIEACLNDAGIKFQSIQTRVKSKKKLRDKYLDPEKDYRSLDDITDLAELRIITYYEDEVDSVAEVIGREFEIDPENSVDKRRTAPDRFGYSAVNFVCAHSKKRGKDVEYKRFAGIRAEIQVTSILRHAWSEIEHEWYDLKDAYPDDVKRRFYRIAALFELAESEFLDIKKDRRQYEQSVAVRVGAHDLDVQVDAVSLRPFIEQERLVAEVDDAIAAALGRRISPEISDRIIERRARAAQLAGMVRLQDIRDKLLKYRTLIPTYSLRCRRELWSHIPPSPILARSCCTT
jgi:ppGpp synthetase/RelA/SpoT-type nucleotidyltranferase